MILEGASLNDKVPVLLVDDQPANLLALEAILAEAEYDVVRVTSGEAAIGALAKRDFAVVLLDVLMPGMDGFETAKQLRDRARGERCIPIIFVTGVDVDPSAIVRGYAEGAVDFIQKPLHPGILRAKVAIFAELYRAHRRLLFEQRRAIDDAVALELAVQARERDVLRRRAAEELLHASEERFRLLVDAVTDYAIFLLDVSGHVATWSAGAKKAKGYETDEILGRHFSVFYTPEDRASGKPEKNLETVRRDGRFEEEGWRVRKDGTHFWADVVISALRNQRGELIGFAKVTRDLTQRRAAQETERKLATERHAREQLEALGRDRDAFLATISHELRTPLNAMSGWASILRKCSLDSARLDRALEVIERNARVQTRLVGDLLDVSRMVAGKLQLRVQNTAILPLIHETAEVVRPAAESKDVRIAVEASPDVGAIVVDPDRLRQILWNLLTNAVRFTPGGGLITVRADRLDSRVEIRVQDTGTGIAPEHLPRLFESVAQVDGSTTRAHGGLGLGLAIVRHLVEAHGGTVSAHSDGPGRGTTIAFSLPVSAVLLANPEDAERQTATVA